MLTENFVAAIQTVRPVNTHLSTTLKDVGIFQFEHQPRLQFQQGWKKSSVSQQCLAASQSHVFAAQTDKAVVNVYSRSRGNQEATVPFPARISCIAFHDSASILILGLRDGRLLLWEITTGRTITSSASHLEPVSHILVAADGEHLVSGSQDNTLQIWSLTDLVSFSRDEDFGTAATTSKTSLRSFSQHRSAISCCAISSAQHLHYSFVVSASDDKICYVWNPGSMQVLKTVLLTEIPASIAIDPADRAAYIGSHDGSMQYISLMNPSEISSSLLSVRNSGTTVQLASIDQWPVHTKDDPGAAQCISINYDGSSALTGHTHGAVLRWDLSKHRCLGEVVNLSGQAVTNIEMFRPTGFCGRANDSPPPNLVVDFVVKPRVGSEDILSSHDGAGSNPVPSDYVMHVQVVGGDTPRIGHTVPIRDCIEKARSTLNRVGLDKTANGYSSGGQWTEQRLAALQQQVDTFEKKEALRREDEIARSKRRDAIGLRKREAFFEAKARGLDGDVAMKAFAWLEKEIDSEPDRLEE